MRIKEPIEQSIALKQKILSDENILSAIDKIVEVCIDAFDNNFKVLFCGNGGSAADAQHLAAELSGRFYYNREPLNSEALHVNTSYLTAVANDYSYDEIYSRYLKGVGNKGDILFGLSTSGNSRNVVNALKTAKEMGIITIGLTGESGGSMKDHSDYLIMIPSNDTPRIQEAHIMIGHIICENIEAEIFPR